jgi:RNA polymerase sigma factor for flagellar operon FliA
MAAQTVALIPPGETRLSEEERSELILRYLPRVKWIASRIYERLPDEVFFEDLVSAGVLGLIEAIDRYDPRYKVKLSTFADHRIRGAILDSVRDFDGVPAHKRPKMKELRRAEGAAAQRLRRTPEAEDVAAELGISMAEYFERTLEVHATRVSSIDCPLKLGSETLKLAEIVADNRKNEPDRVLERIEFWKLVRKAMEELPPGHSKVMRLYYGNGLRLADIAKIMHVHPSRVFQLKADATERLRGVIYEQWMPKTGTLCGYNQLRLTTYGD